MAALFCCSRYSGPASRAGIRRLIIRRMNNSPCNLRATRSKIVQRGGRKPTGNRRAGEGEGGGTKAIISCPVTLRRYVKKLTASRDPPPGPLSLFFSHKRQATWRTTCESAKCETRRARERENRRGRERETKHVSSGRQVDRRREAACRRVYFGAG